MTAEEALAQWNQQLEGVRARRLRSGGKVGFATPAMVANKSGLEFMQAWLAGELPCPPICDTMDFSLVEVGVGKAVFQGTLGPKGLHVGHIVVDGGIDGDKLRKGRPEIAQKMGEERLIDLGGLADAYWFLHQQPPRAWTFELDMRSKVEPW